MKISPPFVRFYSSSRKNGRKSRCERRRWSGQTRKGHPIPKRFPPPTRQRGSGSSHRRASHLWRGVSVPAGERKKRGGQRGEAKGARPAITRRSAPFSHWGGGILAGVFAENPWHGPVHREGVGVLPRRRATAACQGPERPQPIISRNHFTENRRDGASLPRSEPKGRSPDSRVWKSAATAGGRPRGGWGGIAQLPRSAAAHAKEVTAAATPTLVL